MYNTCVDKFRKNYEKIAEIIVRKGIWFQLVFVLFVLFGITAMDVPNQIIYFMDIVTFVIGLLSVKRTMELKFSQAKGIVWYIGALVLYTFIVFIIRHQSLLYYMWGLRNTFRFFVFFLVCVCWIETKDIKDILKIFEIFVYLNVLVCSWQYWIAHLPFDNICGLFGVTTQGSGYMNVLLVIVTASVIVQYLKKMISIRHFLLVIGCGVYISIISELKAYYFELALILFLAFLLFMLEKRKLSRQLTITILVCGAGMLLIAVLTVALNPEYWRGFFLPKGIWEEVTRKSGYSGQGDLNRITAVRDIFVHIFHGGIQSAIGFGLGNCDYSSFEFLITPFYQMYESLHYMWIHVAFLFLELGFIGLILYMVFFVLVGIRAWKNQQCGTEEEKMWNQVALILSVCCFFFLFYNICLRTEAAYMIFFILSVPYAVNRRKKVNKNDT